MKVLQEQTIPTEARKPWVDVIKGNRNHDRGMAVEYVAPALVNGKVEVTINEADIADELLYWDNVVILFALGENLSMHAVKKFMETTWNFVSLPELYYNEAGFFFVKFKNGDDKEKVMTSGPYFIYGKPLFIRYWTPDFEIKEDLLRILPLWVTFPNLPLHLWGEKCLSKIASTVGKPIATNECTAKKLRISYARVLIEVDVTQKPRETVCIKDHNRRVLEQKIEYEWRPKYCHTCLKIGHDCAAPNRVPMQRAKKVWKPVTKSVEESSQSEARVQPKNIMHGNDNVQEGNI